MSSLAEPVAHKSGNKSDRAGGKLTRRQCQSVVDFTVHSCLRFESWYSVAMPAKQPHRKRVRHFHEPGDFHEFTFSCYHRMPLLTNDDWRRRLARSIDSAGNEESIELVAFVFMPEHLHLLVYPTMNEPNLPRYLARIKQPFSKEIKQILIDNESNLLRQLTVRERPGKTCFRFWQEGPGFDRNLFTPKAIEASIDYIHRNPVRRGLCQRATDWKWSSARHYVAEPHQHDPDCPFIHGIPVGAFDDNQIH